MDNKFKDVDSTVAKNKRKESVTKNLLAQDSVMNRLLALCYEKTTRTFFCTHILIDMKNV